MSEKTAAEAVKEVMTAFEEFKATNDNRLAQIEKKGVADPVTVDKLAKIEQAIVVHEDMNQKFTLAQKAAEEATKEVKRLEEALARIEAKAGRPGFGEGAKEEKARVEAEYKAAFDSYLRTQNDGMLNDNERKQLVERKALVAGNDTLGGFYIAPSDMQTEILKNVVLQSPVRSIARVTSLGAKSLLLPKRTGTFAARRVGEVDARTETTGYTTGQVEIHAPEMYAEVRISQQMIEDSMFDIEGEMSGEFVEQFAVKEGTEFVSGTGGSNQAEGFLTNSSVGSQVSGTAATIADVNGQADGLFDLWYKGLKTAYAGNAVWVMNRQTLGSVRKLKDAQKQYIWQPGVAGSQPNTILGARYVELPDMPNEGANTYPIAVGDFYKAYRIVDRVMVSILRDPYTQSGSGQILFRARKRVGGGVVLAEAICKLKCST